MDRSMKIFRLWVKTDMGWLHACTVEAEDMQTAFCDAVLLLRPEHKDLMVQLRTDDCYPPPDGTPQRYIPSAELHA
jgi:hypothetical protein